MNTSFRASSRGISLLAILMIVAAAPSLAASITDLGTFGGPFSQARAINNAGDVVGTADTPATNISHAFLYSGGGMTDLGTLGGVTSGASAINDAGQVTGGWRAADTTQGVFLYSGGIMTDLGLINCNALGINAAGNIVGTCPSGTSDSAYVYAVGSLTLLGTLGGFGSVAEAINDVGQIVGFSAIPGGDDHAFLYSGGSMHDLGTLGGHHSVATAINNSGQIVGYADKNTVLTHAFLYSGGTMIDLGSLGGVQSGAMDINDAGQIVGFSITAANGLDAFLYSDGRMIDLNSILPPGSGWLLTEAFAINNSGQIAGVGQINGQAHAFLLDSTPEPTPVWLLISGTAFLAIRKKLSRAGSILS